jgi:hypothetical protein
VPAALVIIFAVMNGGAIAAIMRGQEVKPTDTWFRWEPTRGWMEAEDAMDRGSRRV